MAKGPEPKWGFNGIADAPSFTFPKRDREAILSAIKQSNNNESTRVFLLDLECQMTATQASVETERNTPTTLEIREALRQTQTSLIDLREKLSGLDLESRRLLRDGLHGTLAEPPAVIDLLAHLDAQHERLQNAVDLAVKKSRTLKSPRRGPKSSMWLQHFENGLALALKENLGILASKNRGGVFAEILTVCLKHIETPLRKNPSRTRTPKATFQRIQKIINRTR
jgi:hypothetical protein